MKAFLDDVKEYIKSAMPQGVSVNNAYSAFVEATPPHIFIEIINGAEEGETFDGEDLSRADLQISVFCQQMTIDEKEFSAQSAALALSDIIKGKFDKVKMTQWNANIKTMRRVGAEFSMPTDALTYAAILRYSISVACPYQKIYKEN
jgi:hypothetical protein